MSELIAIASDFRDLADRFNRSAANGAKLKHIATNLRDNAGKAGRLMYRAIQLGAFPKEHTKANGQWWDISIGRWPGGGLVKPTHEGEATHPAKAKWNAAIGFTSAPVTEADFLMGWTFAISSWLYKAFPARFRSRANEWDFSHVKMDEQGRPCDREGKPLRLRFVVDGKPIPDDLLNESERAALLELPQPMPPAIVERLDNAMPGWKRWGWKLDPVVMVEREYDEADAMEHSRIRCEVYADACKVLAELIEQADSALPTYPSQRIAPMTFLDMAARFDDLVDSEPNTPDDEAWCSIKRLGAQACDLLAELRIEAMPGALPPHFADHNSPMADRQLKRWRWWQTYVIGLSTMFPSRLPGGMTLSGGVLTQHAPGVSGCSWPAHRWRAFARDIAAACRLLDEIHRARQSEAVASPAAVADEKEWLRFVDAERVTGINRGTIKRAADAKEIEDNDKEGDERRIRSASFTRWAINRATKGDEPETEAQVEDKWRKAGR